MFSLHRPVVFRAVSRVSFLVVALVYLAGIVSGQNKTAPEPAPAASNPEYVIEVRTPEGCLFAPLIRSGVPPASTPAKGTPTSAALVSASPSSYSQTSGSLNYTLPRPTQYLPDSAGHPIVSSVGFFARQTGELWNFRVTVGRGEFFDAGSEPVADLMLRTNERAEVNGVARFGLSPFGVAVVKVIGQLAHAPRINIKPQSISLDKVEVGTLPEPHRLTLRNNSDKHVLAIQYNSFKDNKFLFLRWLENTPTQPLIKAGEVYRLEVLSQDLTCGDSDGYRGSQSGRIDIVSAVFADGSYEGAAGLAALIRGQAIGNKKQLQRVVATLENLGGGEEPNAGELIYYLRYLSQELDEVAEPYLAEQLQNSLPPPHRPDSIVFLTNLIRSGQHEVRSALLGDAERLEALNKTQNAAAVRALGARTIAKYKEWLAAVEAVTPH